jgi:hypothetical protein
MLTAGNHFAQCIQEARDHGLVAVLLANLPMLGITQTYSGDPAAGRESCNEALELAKRIGDVRGELLAQLGMMAGLLVEMKIDECRRRADAALKLAQQIGARRFQSECLGIIAATMLSTGEQDALRLAEEAVQIGRETGMSYCGPVLLSIVARITPDAKQRAQALDEGEELLAKGCVSHSYFEFYHNAIEVSLAERAWADVRRYADGLAAYTAAEPLPLTNVLITRARLLADVGERSKKRTLRAQLESVRADCQRMNALGALPAVESALASL